MNNKPSEKQARDILNALEHFGYHFDFDEKLKNEAIKYLKEQGIIGE
jgi:DNA-dependent RNA polymerase auxiliary subunit epsilon